MFGRFKKELKHLLENASHMDAHSNLSSQTWQKIFDSYQTLVTRALDAEAFSIFVYDPVTEDIWLKSGTGIVERQIMVMKDNSIVGRSIARGQPVIDNNMTGHDGAHKQVEAETGFVTRNIICVPIKSQQDNNVIGAVSVLNKKGESGFNETDMEIAEGLAFVLRVVIEDIFFNQREAERLRKFAVKTERAVEVLAMTVVGGMILLMISMLVMVDFLKIFS